MWIIAQYKAHSAAGTRFNPLVLCDICRAESDRILIYVLFLNGISSAAAIKIANIKQRKDYSAGKKLTFKTPWFCFFSYITALKIFSRSDYSTCCKPVRRCAMIVLFAFTLCVMQSRAAIK